ncbi:MAG TPA: hypothetical protein VG672_27925, partial [Bryobacteraceae bacterium]|nr:hypothetical protein [Bryobacteraceae bacterium]
MTPKPAAVRIPDLHRSAFWIYGITAMVMKEPFGVVLRHAAIAGWSDPAVQQEGLRALAVLILMSRQFLAAGIYFDRVYLAPESAEEFPRRNYPFDFLFGLTEMLLVLAGSMIVAVPNSYFDILCALSLIWEPIWLAASKLVGYSTPSNIAPLARIAVGILAISAIVRLAAGESTTMIVLAALGFAHLIRM